MNHRILRRKTRRLARNRIGSVDNLYDEKTQSMAAGTVASRSQSVQELNFTGVTDFSGFPRKFAWKESVGYLEESDKLTEEWLKIWQVECQSFYLKQLVFHLEIP